MAPLVEMVAEAFPKNLSDCNMVSAISLGNSCFKRWTSGPIASRSSAWVLAWGWSASLQVLGNLLFSVVSSFGKSAGRHLTGPRSSPE